MAKNRSDSLIVGLDVGTSKVLALVAERQPDGMLKLLGMGQHPSHGMKKGMIVNIESIVLSMQRAVEQAETAAGCEIKSVYAGIAGSHIASINSHGMVPIKDHEVGPGDVKRVLEAAGAVAIPADQVVIHTVPQMFSIDRQDGIREPLGMNGVRLEADVHIITGASSAMQNMNKCIQRCGLAVEDVILEQLASSMSVLNDDEKDLGVCLLDIGGGTTDISVFTEGALRHTCSIPIAGDQITNDIAIALRTTSHAAEEIKKTQGCALASQTRAGEIVEVPAGEDRPAKRLARQTLAEVIEPRVEELLGLVQSRLKSSGLLNMLGSGIVLTGGTSRMTGIAELAEEVFHMPVRLGLPKYVHGLDGVAANPMFATGVGLLLYGARSQDPLGWLHGMGSPGKGGAGLNRVGAWFKRNF